MGDLVAHGPEFARQPLRAWTRFHADDRALGALEEGEQGVASGLHPLDHRTRVVEAYDMEHVLAEIDAIDGGIPRAIAKH